MRYHRRADRERETIGYPDRDSDPSGHIAARHSCPPWLAVHWIAQLGTEEAAALARAMLVTPPFTVRVNTLKTNREDLCARLAIEGVTAEAGRFSPDALHLSGSIQLPLLPSFREGLFNTVQVNRPRWRHSSGAASGGRVRDLCAAPGGKRPIVPSLLRIAGILACDVARASLSSSHRRRTGSYHYNPTMPVNAAKSLQPLNGALPRHREQTALRAPE